MERKIVSIPNPDPRIEKARMLVALLGADFTKDADHPFFRKASEIATGVNAKAPPSKEMSAALLRLIDALQKRTPPETPPVQVVQTQAVETTHLSVQYKDLMGQHPAVIAQELMELDRETQRDILAALPRIVARQVTVFSLALSDKSTS